MPTTRKAGTRRATRHHKTIRRILILDALRNWAIPIPLAAAALVVWVGAKIELMDTAPAATVGAGLALAAALHGGLREFLDERTTRGIALLVAVFAVVLFVVGFAPLYRTINPPPPVFRGQLRTAAAPVTVPLHAMPGTYRLLVEGHFLPAEEGTERTAHYRLDVEEAGQHRLLEGEFTEQWGRTRLGRRGSAPVHVVHAVTQHRIENPEGADLALQLEELDAPVGNSVTLDVYPDVFPLLPFIGLACLLTAVALAVDARRPATTSTGATGAALAIMVGVAAFHAWAGPQPGFGALAVYGIVGAAVGLPAASLVGRMAGPVVRRFAAR